jgi:hypothetical protein
MSKGQCRKEDGQQLSISYESFGLQRSTRYNRFVAHMLLTAGYALLDARGFHPQPSSGGVVTGVFPGNGKLIAKRGSLGRKT